MISKHKSEEKTKMAVSEREMLWKAHETKTDSEKERKTDRKEIQLPINSRLNFNLIC
jgi:hypothetical protein